MLESVDLCLLEKKLLNVIISDIALFLQLYTIMSNDLLKMIYFQH